MPELEHALRRLGEQVEFPPTPDLASGVRRRLGEAPPRRRWFSRRALAVALAVLVVAVGTAFAVPSARSTILDWLGIKGVDIVRVDELPAVAPPGDLGLGEQVTLAEARARVPYQVVVPHAQGLGDPDDVYVARHGSSYQVSFLWGSSERVRLLFSEFEGFAMVEKMVQPGTSTERVVIKGEPGVWFEGAPHVFLYQDENGDPVKETMRLVERALVWQRGPLTLRLEGDISKEKALEIARSVSTQ
jgi:hypothetical protein